MKVFYNQALEFWNNKQYDACYYAICQANLQDRHNEDIQLLKDKVTPLRSGRTVSIETISSLTRIGIFEYFVERISCTSCGNSNQRKIIDCK
jgi:hypothetical protein